ncbi:hypothetical protein [Ferruginibacter albus]|uniref:hypothetical protein n=1 Tax=Ferruginibacter albus TaxID=2875540 RepID=UPI001CC33917|nr:hypothetical protein [Ferruginibacter albus]UAY52476.1 hypothetical protein K9M53_02010 [Ferruginibacter albus]
MKQVVLLSALFFCFTQSKSQTNSTNEIDSLLEKKITINQFCLCKTTLSNLQSSYKDLKETAIEEMDFGKRCGSGGDSRYTNGKGYYTEQYPGIIFQKDPNEGYISKFRLTKQFVGKLPDGTPINLNNLLLKDLIKQYPEPLFKWSSRGCSDYWTYTNDTISFFLKIDVNKKPQYPLDEAYYLNRPVDAIDVFISCYSVFNKNNSIQLFAPDEPMYFLDDIRTNKSFLENSGLTQNEIALVRVFKDSNAIRLGGKDAKNGLIYIYTKEFARDAYWNYFKLKSEDYKNSITSLEIEKKVTYILNDKVLEDNYEGDLYSINDDNFIELKVISKEQLKKDYKVSNKSFGVVIKSKDKK